MTTPDIFLSYTRDDMAVAKLYADAFAREGLEVWFRRVMGNNPVLEKHLDSIRALWAETEAVA